MAPRKKITAEQVLAEAGTLSVKPTFVQKAGFYLAIGVGGLITVFTIGLLFFLAAHYPAMPVKGPDNLNDLSDAEAVQRYKDLSEVAIKSTQTLFQTVVTQALLPVLTLILGYLFGKGSNHNAD